ncbi:MAG: hypothetical protein KAY24_08235, partial [Candidatus Eisenbacteria sp.]|nr:hypothetical protein [Candidatus Eisenbacteria bacterium]
MKAPLVSLIALVALTWAASGGDSVENPAAAASGDSSEIHWDLELSSSAGHTGRIQLRTDGQLHEGPGATGFSQAAYHFHPIDPHTGGLEEPGIPLDADFNRLDETGGDNRSDGSAAGQGPDRDEWEDLVSRVRGCLDVNSVFTAECQRVWNDFREAVRKEIERLRLSCAAGSDAACQRLRAVQAWYRALLQERLALLKQLYAERCARPSAADALFCAELEQEIEDLEEELAGLGEETDETGEANYRFDLDDRVAAMLAAEQWSALAQIIESEPEAVLSPLARLVLGHAFVATNRNNEAYRLFANSSDPASLAGFDRWTQQLLTAMPDAAAVRYLRGDALARQRRFTEALAVFDALLSTTSPEGHALTIALAWNARGLVQIAFGALEAAGDDFFEATCLAPDLADAHANLAARTLLLSDGLEGAYESAGQALQHSEDFIWALVSQACLEIVRGNWARGREQLEALLKDPDASAVADYDLARLLQVNMEFMQSELASADVPGSVIQRVGKDLSDGMAWANNRIQAAANGAAAAWNRHEARSAATDLGISRGMTQIELGLQKTGPGVGFDFKYQNMTRSDPAHKPTSYRERMKLVDNNRIRLAQDFNRIQQNLHEIERSIYSTPPPLR